MKYIKKFKLWIAFFLLFYTLAGFFAIPWFLTNKVPLMLKNKAGIEILINKAFFNPYTFELTLKNIVINDLQKQPVFKLKKLYINYTVLGLLTKTFLFSDIRLNSPLLYATMDKNGKINLNNIIAKKRDSKKTSNSAKESLPSIMLRKIEIKNGQIKIKDDRKDSKFMMDLGPYDFMAHDISTNKGELNAYSFKTLINNESQMSWQGGMSIEPLKLYGKLTLKALKLPKIYKYALPNMGASLDKGSLWLTLPYQIDISKKVRFRIDNARFHLSNLELKEKKTGKMLVDARNISVSNINLDWPKQNILIENFQIADTNIYPRLNKSGKLNFTEAFTPKQKKKTDSNQTETAKPWSYLLKNAKIARTNIYFDDSSTNKDTKTDLTQIALHVKEISSNKKEPIIYKLSSSLNKKSHILVTGDFVQETMSTNSKISLSNILPTDFLNYFEPYINFKLKSANIDLKADINATFKTNLDLRATADASLKNLAINSKKNKKLLKWQKLSIDNFKLQWPKHSILIDKISLNKALINAKLQKNGEVDLLKAFLPKSDKKQTEKNPTKSKTWKFLVRKATIDRSQLLFLDSSLSKPTKSKLSGIALHVRNISSNKKSPITYSFAGKLNKNTKIRLNGKVIQKPLGIYSKIGLKRLEVVDFENYFLPYINFKLKNASIDIDGHIKANLEKKQRFSLNMNTYINNLLINSAKNQKLLKWKKLSIKGVNFQNSPMSLDIKTLSLDEPYILANIAKDHSSNFSNLIKKSANKKEAKSKKQKEPKSLKLKIGDIKLLNGKTDFSDESLPFPFYTSIHDLNGYITTLDFGSTTPSKLKLEGKIDKYGYADIKGVLLPFKIKQKADIDVLLKNINLTSLTPYSGKFLGYKIKNGRLSMDLNYKISKASLIGKNKINIDTLELGESVESKDAVHLPLKLALALLKDSNNQIDIDLPVSGDMNNPDFSYGSIVWKAVGNMITGIVTAPFKFLGSLLGIKGEDLKAIDFEAGSHKIISSEVEKLENLNKILGKRPNIKLEIAGGYSMIADTKELQKQKLEQIIKIELKKLKKDTNSTQSDDYSKVLQKLYVKTFSNKQYMKLKQKFTSTPKRDTKQSKKTKAKPTLDITALNSQIQNDLALKLKIPKSKLISLANKRANNIKNTLIQKYKLAKERVKILAPKEIEAKRDRWIACELKISI